MKQPLITFVGMKNKTNALSRKGGKIMFNKFGRRDLSPFHMLFNRKIISGAYCI